MSYTQPKPTKKLCPDCKRAMLRESVGYHPTVPAPGHVLLYCARCEYSKNVKLDEVA